VVIAVIGVASTSRRETTPGLHVDGIFTDAYSSNAAQAFPDLLRSFAQESNLEQSTIDDLVSASDGIEASQIASTSFQTELLAL
jgi:hypothetical protein